MRRLNLHNYLFREARRLGGVDDDGLMARGNIAEELLPEREMTPSEAEEWNRAVHFYVDRVVDAPRPDSVVIRVNNALAASTDPNLDDVRIEREWRDVLRSVEPLYSEVFWPAHSARNRRWIVGARGYLDRYEPCLAPRLAAALGGEWPGTPIRVDVTVYASWAAAYTTFDPTHITVSSTALGTQGPFGLELLLHEAGHSLMETVEAALTEAATHRGGGATDELAHLLLFYTAGDLVWRAIPGYPTAAAEFGIWSRNARSRAVRDLLRREWKPYLDGRRSLAEAADALVAGSRRAAAR